MQSDDAPQSARTTQLSTTVLTWLEDLDNSILELELDGILDLVNSSLKNLESTPASDDRYTKVCILHAIGDLHQAIDGVRLHRDFAGAIPLLGKALKSFAQFGLSEKTELATGLILYYRGAVEAKLRNISQAGLLITRARDHLKKAGGYGKGFEFLVDRMHPETLFIAALEQIQLLDFAAASTLIDQASAASTQNAEKYCETQDPDRHEYLGLADHYHAYFTFWDSVLRLGKFDFSHFENGLALAAPALSAAKHFELFGSDQLSIRNLRHMAEGMGAAIQAMALISDAISSLSSAPVKAPNSRLIEARKQLAISKTSFSSAGTDCLPLLRIADNLLELVRNIGEVRRPKPKDFGVYSGIIACILFPLVLSSTACANKWLEIGITPWNHMWVAMVLALVGGFGYGAIRFKSFFSSPKEKG